MWVRLLPCLYSARATAFMTALLGTFRQGTVACHLWIVSSWLLRLNKYLCYVFGVLLLLITFLIYCGACQVHTTSVTLVRSGTFYGDCTSAQLKIKAVATVDYGSIMCCDICAMRQRHGWFTSDVHGLSEELLLKVTNHSPERTLR